MTIIFYDISQMLMGGYVNDIVMKWKTSDGHESTLKKVFDRCWLYKVTLNPTRCAFGVAIEKFLGFLVYQSGVRR